MNEARLAAETLSHRRAATPEELDAEADALGRLVNARVTFVAPDGAVVGDSELDARGAAIAREPRRPSGDRRSRAREGVGIARRYSTTLTTSMLYVAVTGAQPGRAAHRRRSGCRCR